MKQLLENKDFDKMKGILDEMNVLTDKEMGFWKSV